MAPISGRLKSIDVFRAITMLLMIFVNDLDPVKNVPVWIKHAGRDMDSLGFADTIFPAFLFIVGLSIPYAINNKLKKTGSGSEVLLHIALRSIALLAMGFIHVNLEHYSAAALLPRSVWEIIITVCFFLIWLDYPASFSRKKQFLFQFIGLALLLAACFLFKGDDNGQVVGLRPYWWGILGLIGWSYLICALIFFISKGRLVVIILSLVFFFLFNISFHAGLTANAGIKDYVWIVGNASMPAFTMAGTLVSILYSKLLKRNNFSYIPVLLLMALAFIFIGFAVRPYGGISKIRDTPSWVGICTGISIFAFVLIIWLTDIKGKANLFKWIMPGGTNTLTCYLIPYILYSLFELVRFHYPEYLNQGAGGIIRSFLVAFIVIRIAGLLEKISIKIKI